MDMSIAMRWPEEEEVRQVMTEEEEEMKMM